MSVTPTYTNNLTVPLRATDRRVGDSLSARSSLRAMKTNEASVLGLHSAQ